MSTETMSRPGAGIDELLAVALAAAEDAAAPVEPRPFTSVAVDQAAAFGYVAGLQDAANLLERTHIDVSFGVDAVGDLDELRTSGLMIVVQEDGGVQARSVADVFALLRAHQHDARSGAVVALTDANPRARAGAALDVVFWDSYGAAIAEAAEALGRPRSITTPPPATSKEQTQ